MKKEEVKLQDILVIITFSVLFGVILVVFIWFSTNPPQGGSAEVATTVEVIAIEENESASITPVTTNTPKPPNTPYITQTNTPTIVMSMTPSITIVPTETDTPTPTGRNSYATPTPTWWPDVECSTTSTEEIYPCIALALPDDNYSKLADRYYRDYSKWPLIQHYNRDNDGKYRFVVAGNQYIIPNKNDYQFNPFGWPECITFGVGRNQRPCIHKVFEGDTFLSISQGVFSTEIYADLIRKNNTALPDVVADDGEGKIANDCYLIIPQP